jgi:hypothetical protein
MTEYFFQLLPFTVWIVISIIPSIRLLRRIGIHPTLAAFNIMPFIGTIILLWIVAYSKWPTLPAPLPDATS